MGDYGIKVTKDGYDVFTATILNQTFNSEKNCLKIFMSGSSSSNGLSDGQNITITHNLGYAPAFLLFWEVSNNGKWYALGDTDGTYSVDATSYTNNLRAFVRMASGTVNLKIYYYIFIEQGEE